MTNWSPEDKKLLIDYYNQGMWQPEHIKVFNDYVLKVRSLKTCSKNRVNGRIKARIVERPEIYV